MKKGTLVFLICLLLPTLMQAQIITTIAGNGTYGFVGDGGPATSAELEYPWGVTIDASGNMYIADFTNVRIRKVDISGVISTIAGNGTVGYSGDGGPATDAELSGPSAVAVDGSGNVYIADYYNQVIRMVNTSGNISTIVGNGTAGYSGNNGAATAAELNYPDGIAVDAFGNVYIADRNNGVIRKVNASGIIFTIAGNGTEGYAGDGLQATVAMLNKPDGIAVDDSGRVYIADEYNNRIRKIDTNGIIYTVAGNGSGGYSGDGSFATIAKLNEPCGVTVDNAGNIYIADAVNNRIRFVNSYGMISTIAGNGDPGYTGDNGPATNAKLNDPYGIAVNLTEGSVSFVDQGNNCIRILTDIAGINTISTRNGNVTIYPNPSNGVLNVQLQTLREKSNIEVYNLIGEKIYSAVINSTSTQIDLSNQPAGIYLYRVVSETGEPIATGKLIIEK